MVQTPSRTALCSPPAREYKFWCHSLLLGQDSRYLPGPGCWRVRSDACKAITLFLRLATKREVLAAIYVKRGLDAKLAKKVALQLMDKDALGAHARDELGISDTLRARPLQAAVASATSFGVGAGVPLLTATVATGMNLIPFVAGISIGFLALLGALAARVGGAGMSIFH